MVAYDSKHNHLMVIHRIKCHWGLGIPVSELCNRKIFCRFLNSTLAQNNKVHLTCDCDLKHCIGFLIIVKTIVFVCASSLLSFCRIKHFYSFVVYVEDYKKCAVRLKY